MQKWLVLVFSGIVMVLVESSLLAWPWVLLYVYLLPETDTKWEIFWLMILGIILDVLMVRTIGVSSLALLAFFGVLMILRKSFTGNLRVEGLWLLACVLVWNLFLGTGSGFVFLVLVSLGVIFFNRQFGNREIKLIR